MDVRTAAKMTGRSNTYIYGLIHSGKLPAKKITVTPLKEGWTEERWCIDQKDLDKFANDSLPRLDFKAKTIPERLLDSGRLLTASELSLILKREIRDIYYTVKACNMPFTLKGTAYRFDIEKIKEWMKQGNKILYAADADKINTLPVVKEISVPAKSSHERIRLLPIKELSEAINYSRTSIRKFCELGMPHYRLGRNYRFCLSDVEKWLNGRIKQENIMGLIYSDDPRLLPMNY